MKAMLCKAYGPPETLVLSDVPSSKPGPSQIVITVKACGVNFPDVLIIENKYQFKPALPFAPGAEIAGVVKALGEGVTRFKIGDRVIASVGNGGMQEEVVVDPNRCIPMPDGMDFETGAGLILTYGTSHYALKDRAKLKSGEVYNKREADTTKSLFQQTYGYRGYNPTIIERVAYREQEPGKVDVFYEFEERPRSRVGQVIIVNNNVTKDNVIRRQLVGLNPGQILEWPNLKAAEVNLARLNIFEINAEQGIRPTVTILDPEGDSDTKDILVSVQEARTGSLLFGVGVNSDAGLTGSIVLNERNFDIMRPPTSWDDLLSGRAWRGAGQELRIEAVPGTQLQRYTATFREPSLFDSLYSLTTSGYFYDRIYNEDVEQRLGTRITIGRQLFVLRCTRVRDRTLGSADCPAGK